MQGKIMKKKPVQKLKQLGTARRLFSFHVAAVKRKDINQEQLIRQCQCKKERIQLSNRCALAVATLPIYFLCKANHITQGNRNVTNKNRCIMTQRKKRQAKNRGKVSVQKIRVFYTEVKVKYTHTQRQIHIHPPETRYISQGGKVTYKSNSQQKWSKTKHVTHIIKHRCILIPRRRRSSNAKMMKNRVRGGKRRCEPNVALQKSTTSPIIPCSYVERGPLPVHGFCS